MDTVENVMAMVLKQPVLIPSFHRAKFEIFIKKISTTDDLSELINESAQMSFLEEALARVFVSKGLDSQLFLKVAKFETSKAILRGELN